MAELAYAFEGTPIPPGAVDPSLDMLAEITRLKKEQNAVILAHYYQTPEIQDIADFVGDSLDLSRKAAATDADVIAFCGVRFMAEVAKIMSPGKKVVVPDMKAGCSLEDSCPPEKFAAFRRAHPDHISLTYVNCSAAVKAHSDIIVTSSNAEAIIRQIPKDQKILFAPDRHLGAYLSKITGRNMLLWEGACIVHEQFSERELIKLMARHPGAPVVAHPECPAQILDYADHVGSTSSILKYTESHSARTFIIATEPHIMHQMQKESPEKTFIGAPGADGNCNCNICPFMGLNSIEKLYLALRDLTPEITVDELTRVRALKPLKRMMDMSPKSMAVGDISTIAR